MDPMSYKREYLGSQKAVLRASATARAHLRSALEGTQPTFKPETGVYGLKEL